MDNFFHKGCTLRSFLHKGCTFSQVWWTYNSFLHRSCTLSRVWWTSFSSIEDLLQTEIGGHIFLHRGCTFSGVWWTTIFHFLSPTLLFCSKEPSWGNQNCVVDRILKSSDQLFWHKPTLTSYYRPSCWCKQFFFSRLTKQWIIVRSSTSFQSFWAMSAHSRKNTHKYTAENPVVDHNNKNPQFPN